ncbi:tetratricopeptide (TPR) repeat protein [Methanococcus maripaludis]|uniref:Tetratricopeptide (TPR) repeat protein n=1 Tax=Methanococcus maripaludis TaxID=39152 RepID=A0A7J9NIH4_METMI|nr:tetratricopeptide repeat protein [Methanococcus maripaludis]MBA2840351.1 tetratricopeptide (TPR) repeat protein [Methanococcus maripaludis]
MADYNNAVVFYDTNGIEYSKQIKKTLERGFERECFLINLDNRENTLSRLNLAMKTGKYVIFLFSSMYSNENMLDEAKTAYNSDKYIISLKLDDPELKKQISIHQPEFEDNYSLSKKVNDEVEKLKKMEKKGTDFVESQISFNMGNIYFNFGKYAEAIRCYKKAVKIIPDFVDALHNFNSLSNMNLFNMSEETKKPVLYKDVKIDDLVPDIFSKTVQEESEEPQKYSELEPEELEDLILEGEIGKNFEETESEDEVTEKIDDKLPEIDESEDNSETQPEDELNENFEEDIKEDIRYETFEVTDPEEKNEISDENLEVSIVEPEFEEEIIFELEKETERPEIEENLESVFEVPEELVEDVEILDAIEEDIENELENSEGLIDEKLETLDELLDKSELESELVEEYTYEIDNKEFLEILSFANTLYESGEFEAAKTEYKKAIALNPGHSEAHNHYGCLLEYLEKYGEAEIEFKKAIALDGSNSKAHNNLATFLAKSEKYNEAEEHYKKAFEIDPDYWAAIYNLAAMYAALKRYDEAVAQVKSMVKIFRSDGNIKEVLELKKLIKHLKKLKIQKS